MSEQSSGKNTQPGRRGWLTGGPLLTVLLFAGPQIPGLLSRLFSGAPDGVYSLATVYGGAAVTLIGAGVLVHFLGSRKPAAASRASEASEPERE
ncbi:hypothetical protein [Arthrobacter sp. Edens01]|uniref:hypothetical protein n=1 Tax=Arthrobacter sp. Edens01 TaxID=1732020 RepID=UPI0006DA5B29|nr:hypothetical protein [Arthrobacter sp. Edens01]KPN16276.1 hypothetical protein AO716_15425 [Arthrobacter sp. Edens01]